MTFRTPKDQFASMSAGGVEHGVFVCAENRFDPFSVSCEICGRAVDKKDRYVVFGACCASSVAHPACLEATFLGNHPHIPCPWCVRKGSMVIGRDEASLWVAMRFALVHNLLPLSRLTPSQRVGGLHIACDGPAAVLEGDAAWLAEGQASVSWQTLVDAGVTVRTFETLGLSFRAFASFFPHALHTRPVGPASAAELSWMLAKPWPGVLQAISIFVGAPLPVAILSKVSDEFLVKSEFGPTTLLTSTADDDDFKDICKRMRRIVREDTRWSRAAVKLFIKMG